MENKLKAKREQMGFSQKSFADYLGIPLSSYNLYENGNRQIPVVIVNKICKKLNVKREDIFLPERFALSK